MEEKRLSRRAPGFGKCVCGWWGVVALGWQLLKHGDQLYFTNRGNTGRIFPPLMGGKHSIGARTPSVEPSLVWTTIFCFEVSKGILNELPTSKTDER